ncbi:hypothetical protein ACTHT4_03270 [Neisseria sp. P0022.S007]|uniref:hypothetical protein n=1 Tax=unclassified Neisseria TaxID=2623750 RepID=UPI003F7E5712
MFDTQRVPVKVYRWDDEGAPQVESAAGSIKTILKACLVTGYGEGNKRKDALGWEMAFEKAQEACFRSMHPKATKWWLGVDDTKYLAGGDRNSRYTDVCGILEPTSATAGKKVQYVWRNSDRVRFTSAYYSDNSFRLEWVLVGHARAFALILLGPDNSSISPVLYFGEFPSLAVADEHQNLLGLGGPGDRRYFTLNDTNAFHCSAMRDYKGDAPNAFYCGANVVQSSVPYPSPISGGFTASDLYLFEELNGSKYAIRGLVPGLMRTNEEMPSNSVIPQGTVYDNLDNSGDEWMYAKVFGNRSGLLINLTAWEL